MIRRIWRGAAALTWLVAVPVAGYAQQNGAPTLSAVQDLVLNPSTAATLADRISEVDAVIRVRAGDQRDVKLGPVRVLPATESLPQYEQPPLVYTEYEVSVLEVLKVHPHAAPAGTTFRVAQGGGEAIWKNYRITGAKANADLIAGQEYILFVTYDGETGTMRLSPYDTYRVVGRRLTTEHGGLPYSAHLLQLDTASALAAIRSAADQRR